MKPALELSREKDNQDVSASSSASVLVISLDADGCIYHLKILKLLHDLTPDQKLDVYIRENNVLLDFLVEQAQSKSYKKIILMAGSLRQSKKLDDVNGKLRFGGIGLGLISTGSFFPTLIAIAEALKSRLSDIEVCVDRFLMSDVYGEKTSGENFNAVLNSSQDYAFSDSTLDMSSSSRHRIDSTAAVHSNYSIS